ncbi:hypothetical protein Msm_1335 [Methanobrevibacter smithii ATCC 35061]|jgi:hypothetical protein|uniref:Uncharacterized protein n=1 Tax=Methanobrevibacter smithii (strain ATCC 35061 / DSM 861 / OCM 144 / PS) TaxID=420247 RepID=A5UMW2_METS3|nr:hypothetical protein Msm_1335 [Methanobrevibacter smithii ATCC 35061]
MLIFEQFFLFYSFFLMIGAKYFLKGSDFLSKWGIGILSLYSFVSWLTCS